MRPMVLAMSFVGSLVLYCDLADAQLFGSRALGKSFSSRRSLPAANRFVRQNRSGADFVGNDTRDQSGFVGNTQARRQGSVPAATESLRDRQPPRINQPAQVPSANGRYAPRLVSSFSFNARSAVRSQRVTQRSLQRLNGTEQFAAISVSVVGRVATLQGEVASAHQRSLAELMALFDPGIDRVQNELRIREN